ncbi:MAG: 3-dehydroquinate synthase [Planctomycetes bacterium]|nr:3-dehydroquinate synthase [Planctomycetota bacterium]
MEGSAADFTGDRYAQGFAVPFDYPVIFARRVFDSGNPLFADVLDRRGEQRRHRAVFYIDDGVARAHPNLPGAIKEYFHARPDALELAATPEVKPGGERAKTDWQVVRDVMFAIGNLHLDRQSFVVGIGGGAFLDMVGFAASIVHRGLRLVRLPTTTLAQDDAGIGVKNGMNEHGMKNFVGTFAPPFAVIDDFAFLPTLAQEDWVGGVAEAFKVAIIKDAAFFEFLCARAGDLRRRDQRAMEEVVRRCAILHLEHIRTNGDPFEFGSARPLDFGHWAAHKLEGMSGYAIGHGQAVAIGIAIDAYYAMRQRWIDEREFDRIVAGLLETGLPIWAEELDARTPEGVLVVLDGLRDFREHLGGVLTVTFPDGIGRKREVHAMSPILIEEAIAALRARAAREPRADAH